MAFTVATPATTLIPWGQVRLKVLAGATSTASKPFVIDEIGAIDIEKKYLDIMAFSATGIKQLLNRFQNEQPSGIVEFSSKEFQDDGASYLGKTTNVELTQVYPGGTLGWKYLAAKATLEQITIDPKVDGTPSMQKYRVVPYNDTLGTALYTFDAAWTPN